MKGYLLAALLAASTLASPANAQIGASVVLDPTQSAHAVQQIIQGSQIYTTNLQTLTNVMETYTPADSRQG